MKNIVLIPGAWMGGWVWEPVMAGLVPLNYPVYPVTLSGLADSTSDVSAIGLDTHVQDVVGMIEQHHLDQVMVVGHSYAGIVAGLVADQLPERVVHTVLIDGFLAQPGQSLLDAFEPGQAEMERQQIAQHQGRWPAPTAAEIAHEQDLSPAQQQWLLARFVGHPGATIDQPAYLRQPLSVQHTTYISGTFSGRAQSPEVLAMQSAPNWQFRTLPAGHWSMVSVPEILTCMLAEIASAI